MIVTERFKKVALLINKMTSSRDMYQQQSRAILNRINSAISNANKSSVYDQQQRNGTIRTAYELFIYLAKHGALGQEAKLTYLKERIKKPELSIYDPSTDVVTENAAYAESRRASILQFPQETSPVHSQPAAQNEDGNKYRYHQTMYAQYTAAKSKVQKTYLNIVEAFKRLRQGVYERKESIWFNYYAIKTPD